MAKIKLKQVDGISRKKASDAYESFMRHCKLKNLSPYSILYYEKNVTFFLASLPGVKYVDVRLVWSYRWRHQIVIE